MSEPTPGLAAILADKVQLAESLANRFVTLGLSDALLIGAALERTAELERALGEWAGAGDIRMFHVLHDGSAARANV